MTKDQAVPSSGNHRRWGLGVIVAVFLALLAAPTPAGMSADAHRLAAITFLMASLWVTQIIPLAATSLLPLALFPIFGIQAAGDVSRAFVNDKVFLYLGGFVIALSIERWQLHRRIALRIVNLVGSSPRRLVFGFMLATAAQSMWISNTATTLLMLPIAIALLKTMKDEGKESAATAEKLTVPLLLGIAYSASLGGLTTIVGTPTNNAAVGIYHEQFPQSAEISVARWMIACLPIGAVYLGITWGVLTLFLPSRADSDAALREQLRIRLRELGRMTSAERRVLVIFVATAALWIFRRPLEFGSFQLLPGWVSLMESWFVWLGSEPERAAALAKFPNDSTVAILLAITLFFIPSGTQDDSGRSVPLMDWPTASRLPWDIILLFGGGFALAGAFGEGVTNLAGWIGQAMQTPLSGQPVWLVIAITCMLMTFLTEFTSNVATVSTILPSLLIICEPLGIDPRMLMIPATLATSCAFMLPIATPPNAIVFGSGMIRVPQMVRYGVLLNLLGVPLLTLAAWLLIKPLMGIS